MDAGDQLAQAVRTADPDRYLSVLYAPAELRGDLFAIYAFNAEVAAVRDRVSEPLPGEIRLQWWRDVIAGTTEAAGHPVAAALLATIDRHRLPRSAFENHLEARIFDLYDDPMPSRNDLEGYCGETASTLIQLAALVLQSSAATATSELSGHAGCAQAMTGLLRLLPLHRARGQCYLPRDILAAAGTTAEQFVAGLDEASAARAVQAMAALAREHLNAFVAGARNLPSPLRPAFLPASLASVYLGRIEREPQRALRQSPDVAAARRHWHMLVHAMRGWR